MIQQVMIFAERKWSWLEMLNLTLNVSCLSQMEDAGQSPAMLYVVDSVQLDPSLPETMITLLPGDYTDTDL